MSTGPANPTVSRLQPGMLTGEVQERAGQKRAELEKADPRLRSALLNQVIPKLTALNRAIRDSQSMHRLTGDPVFAQPERPFRPAPGADRARELASLLAVGRTADRLALYEDLIEEGASFDVICESVMAPAIRRLGTCWLEDLMSFAEVSASSAALHSDLLWLAGRLGDGGLSQLLAAQARRILIFAFPGDRHQFGAAMLSEVFRREGWEVSHCAPSVEEEALTQVIEESFDIVAISLSRQELLPFVGAFIAALRAQARNPHLRVMIGGPAIEGLAAAKRLGADATSFTGQDAVNQAISLHEAVLRTNPAERSIRS
jgi:methanogenic corrinoid protein MtbC1